MTSTMDVEDDSMTSDDWKVRGNDLYKEKEYEQAIGAYTSAISLDSSNAALYTNRAAAYLMLLRHKDAAADCDSAIALDGGFAKAYFRKATALKGLGNIDSAIACLSRGIDLDPSSRVAVTDRDQLVAAKEQVVRLKGLVEGKEYRRALIGIDDLSKVVGSTFRDVNILKVECLIELHRPEEAYNLSNAMMRSGSVGDVDLLRVRAKCFYMMGDTENSVKHLQSAMRSDPDNTSVRAFYRKVREIEEKREAGNAAFKRGAHEDAIANWSAAIDLDKSNKSVTSKLYNNRATALSKLKRYEDAVQDCNRAIAGNASYAKAYLRRAECQFAIGTPESLQKCISDYEKIAELQPDDLESYNLESKLKQAKVALKRSNQKDLYKILGVSRTADDEEIRRAYKKSALRHHPDKQAGKSDEEKAAAENLFKGIGEAYEILSDPEKRSRYDSGVDVEDIDNPHGGGGHSHGGGGMHGGIDPNILFQMFMQQQMRGGRGPSF